MNNERYANYMIRKCSTAVALAVIKTKPRDLTLMEYINELRVKGDSHLDLFQDIFISESDFFDPDDEDINDSNRDFENGTNQTNDLGNIPCNSITVFNDEDKERIERNIHRKEFVSDVDICEADFNNSVSILKDIDKANPTEEEARNNSIKEILNIYKEIDTSERNEEFITTSTPNRCTQSTICETAQENLSNNFNMNSKETSAVPHDSNVDNYKNAVLPNKARDSQETELYTLYSFTDNFSHISQSQDNINVPMNWLDNRYYRLKTTDHNNEASKSSKLENTDNAPRTVDKFVDSNINSKYEYNVTEKQISDSTFHGVNINIEKRNTVEAFSSNALLSKHDTVGNKKHQTAKTPASSDEYCSLFRDGTKNSRNRKHSVEESQNKTIIFSGSFDKTTFTSISFLRDTEASSSCCPTDFLSKQNNQANSMVYNAGTEIGSAKETHRSSLSDNQFLLSNSIQELSSKNYFNEDNSDSVVVNTKTDEQVIMEKNNCKCSQFESGYETQCTSKNDKISHDHNVMENKSDTTDRLEEMVAFKIFEELNRIKNYIGRQGRHLSDSGRINSQGSQLSGVRINESGYCLLNYIMEYPLVAKTMEITEEVSQVLGKFVDKLHEEENYPHFLEKILERVDELLTEIYVANRDEDLLKKDEQMNRVLLLNRSKNITMYTIEKMLPLLEDVCAMLEKNDLMEIECLGKCENLCYVFHLLEILLKRYNAVASSQSNTQLSQNNKSLKRSTITEIWRKKWNLSKTDVSEGSFKKKCAITQISEVLNKIIVKGMDGYSLIAFAALQCFNLLQSK